MTIEFFTGFEGCGSGADVTGFFDYQVYLGLHTTGGYDNSRCGYINNRGARFYKNITACKTVCTGMHVTGLGTESGWDDYDPIYKFTVGSDLIRVKNESTGIKVYRGGTVIASYGTPISSSQNHIEFKLFSDATAGTVQLKLNGILVIDEDSLDTDGGDITQILWGCTYTDPVYWDNIFIADDWQGILISVLCQPTSDSAVDFTPSTGTDNYAMVDEVAQDGDTTYVESETVGNKDLYGYEDVTTGYDVVAVCVATTSKKDDAAAKGLQVIANQDSTDYDIGSAVALSETYEREINILNLAPDGTAWTKTKFDAITWGFEVAS
jgi:hypothetical protein